MVNRSSLVQFVWVIGAEMGCRWLQWSNPPSLAQWAFTRGHGGWMGCTSYSWASGLMSSSSSCALDSASGGFMGFAVLMVLKNQLGDSGEAQWGGWQRAGGSSAVTDSKNMLVSCASHTCLSPFNNEKKTLPTSFVGRERHCGGLRAMYALASLSSGK